jgi:hypothetical protein
MGVLGAVAVFALISMRQDRNLFAEGLEKVGSKAAAVAAPAAAPASPMRKCVIDGKTVVSNTECADKGTVIEIHDTRGIEAPKAPPKPAPEPVQSATARAIEQATR